MFSIKFCKPKLTKFLQGFQSKQLHRGFFRSFSHPTRSVTICGGGNGAHAFVVTAASKFSPRCRVNWLSLYGDEADRINASLRKNDGIIKGIFSQENAIVGARPNLVTKDPAQAIPESDIIVLCVPAFAHHEYLEAINAHHEVCKNADSNKKLIVASFPSACGLEFDFRRTLRNVHNIALFNCLTLPWACRINEYGGDVEVLGIKDNIDNYVYASDALLKEVDVVGNLQDLFLDGKPKLSCNYDVHVLSSSLGSMNPIIHNAIMYSQWIGYNGDLMNHKPLFYQGISKKGADMMSKLSDEVLAISNKFNEIGKKLNPKFRKISFPHIKEWYEESYGSDCTDTSSLYGLIHTNPGYKGLTHPMKKSEKDATKYVPDFGYRYLTEDIPFGLLVTKAMACMLQESGNGVKTEILDKVLLWAEKVMNRKFFIADEKTGALTIDVHSKDIAHSRVPQLFGINSVEDVVQM